MKKIEQVKYMLELFDSGEMKFNMRGHSYRQSLEKVLVNLYERFNKLIKMDDDEIVEVDSSDLLARFPGLFDEDTNPIFTYTKEELLTDFLDGFEFDGNTLSFYVLSENFRCKNESCFSDPDCIQPAEAPEFKYHDGCIYPKVSSVCGKVELNIHAKNKLNMFYVIFVLLVHNNWRREQSENNAQKYYHLDDKLIIEFKDDSYFLNDVELTLKKLEEELRENLNNSEFIK